MKGAMVAGSVRNGGGVLVGLLRCGHCSRKLKVHHNGLRGVARYLCIDASTNHGALTKCIAFCNMRVDAAVSAEVLRVISPLAIEAALEATAERQRASTDRINQLGLALEQACYEETRARPQYDAVESENRMVVGELERRWNERLMEVAQLEAEIQATHEIHTETTISEAERMELVALAEDLPRTWDHPAASAETRKRILRAVLEEIIVTMEPAHLHFRLHWKGGEHRWKTSAATEQLIHDLARLLPDASIAGVRNRMSVRSAKGHTWTQLRVRNFRAERGIAIYRAGERAERDELILIRRSRNQ